MAVAMAMTHMQAYRGWSFQIELHAPSINMTAHMRKADTPGQASMNKFQDISSVCSASKRLREAVS